MENENYDIDLVYLWVDGNDPVWQAKRNTFTKHMLENTENNCKGRYANNNELKYSLRSVEKYAPWVRKIFIVTDSQTPDWLDTSNPKVRIVDHSEIMPPESLPCFNSSLIEHYLYKIPGLSEHFLFANDDMFFNADVKPADFFTPNGFPVVRLTRRPFRKWRWIFREKIRRKPLKNYRKMLDNSSRIVEKRFGTYYTGLPHHNIDAYLKSDYKRYVEDVLRDEIERGGQNRMRNDKDIHRSVFSYMAIAEGRAKRRYVTAREALHIQIHKEKGYRTLKRYHPILFCMNDSEYAKDTDRKRSKAYLEKRFPDKSEFEK